MVIGYIINVLTARMAGGWVYRVLVAPGVIIHELSHALGCLLTFSKIQSINVFKRDGGELKHSGSPIPLIGNVIISLMPVVVGVGILYFLPNLFVIFHLQQINIQQVNLSHPELARLDSHLARQVSGSLEMLKQVQHDIFNLQFLKNLLNFIPYSYFSWQFWVFVYLIFNLVATMAPSSQDIKVIGWDLLVLAGIFYLLAIFNITLSIATFLPILVLSLIYSIIVLVIIGVIYLVLKFI